MTAIKRFMCLAKSGECRAVLDQDSGTFMLVSEHEAANAALQAKLSTIEAAAEDATEYVLAMANAELRARLAEWRKVLEGIAANVTDMEGIRNASPWFKGAANAFNTDAKTARAALAREKYSA